MRTTAFSSGHRRGDAHGPRRRLIDAVGGAVLPGLEGRGDDGRASRLDHREARRAPLVVSIPHAGIELAGFEPAFVDPWLARKDADWRLDELYDFVDPLGVTFVRTQLSRL